MPPVPIMTENTLFYGDNLDILREYIASGNESGKGHEAADATRYIWECEGYD